MRSPIEKGHARSRPMMRRILVTPRSLTQGDHPQLQRLRNAGFELVFCRSGQLPREDELLSLLPGICGYLAGVESINANVLGAADSLRLIARNGTGVNNIDLRAAKDLGIDVLPAPGANARGVAELAIGLMIAVARAIPSSDRGLKAGEWKRRNGIELEGRTLGLVGCGNVGRRVARIAIGMDMNVVAHDACPDRAFAPSMAFGFAPLDEVLVRADVLSLHCPPTPDGRPLLDNQTIKCLKHGVIVINTARADLIDNAAIANAIAAGHVAGLGIDVFDPEPPGELALLRDERVVATPHIGGLTTESIERAVKGAVDNLLNYLGPA